MKRSSSALISFLLLSCFLLASAQKPKPKPKPKCHPTDQNAIQQIQASFGINSTGDCCDWEFVSCDYFPPYNRVTSFQALNSNISGQISPAIGDLSNLERLQITNAPNLTGNIPPTISKLSRLTSISITNTRISGLIPESFGNLTNEFYSLNLSSNLLTGPIPKSLGNLNMGDIDLSENSFTGDASFLFNENTTSSPVISEFALSLDLTGNNFSFDFSKVKVSFNMAVLHMSHNNIFGSLPKDLTQATFLNDFDVSHNMLCGKIPVGGKLQRTQISSYAYNKCLCGAPLPPCVKVNHLLVSNQTSGSESSPLPHLRDLCIIVFIVLASIYIIT